MAAGAAAAMAAAHAKQKGHEDGRTQAEILAEKAAMFGIKSDNAEKRERTRLQKYCSAHFDCCNDPDWDQAKEPRPDWEPSGGCGRTYKSIGNLCDKLIESTPWKVFGLLVILACAVNVGLQTNPSFGCINSREAKEVDILKSSDDWHWTKVRTVSLNAAMGKKPNPVNSFDIALDSPARYWRLQLVSFHEGSDADDGGLMRVAFKGCTAPGTCDDTAWPYTARASSCESDGRCASNLGKLSSPWSKDFNMDHPNDWLTKLGERNNATVTFDLGTKLQVGVVEIWNQNEEACSSAGAVCAYIDLFILWYFTVELFIVLVKYKNMPCFFWADPWNVFDFVVVVACHMPFGGSSTGVLRLLRLLRVLKLLKRIKQLQVIVNGLIMGLKEIVYLFLLMIIVFYFFAVIALLFLKDNDPRHFGDMFICFVTLFRLATLDGWAAVLYVSMFGCDHFGYDDGVCTNGVNGMNPEDYSPGGVTKWRAKPAPQEAIAIFFFVAFVVVAALVLLSMFIGIVTTSMFTATEAYEQEAAEEQGDKDKAAAAIKLAKLMKTDEMKNTIRAISGEKLSAEEMGMVAEQNSGIWALYMPICDVMYTISRSSWFGTTMLLIILLASVLVGMSAGGWDEIYDRYGHPTGVYDKDRENIMNILNKFVLYSFTVEIFVKLMAERKKPWKYFYQGWNVFDFLVVVGCYIPGAPQDILQLLRLLRVLKVVRGIKQLHVIVSGLMKGMGAIGYIAVLLFLVYYIFAIVAMILFKDNDPFHFGTLPLSILTLFRISTLDTWTDIMYINMYGCHRYYYHDSDEAEVPSGIDANRYMHVGMQFKYWYDEKNWMCDKDKVTPRLYMTPLFFVVYITIATFMMLSLFIGVITTSMGEATVEQKKFLEIDAKIKQCQAMFGLRDDQVANYRVLFSAMDADGGGALDMDELRTALQFIFPNQTEDELMAFVAKVDRDGGGEVDEAEFVEAIIFSVMCPPGEGTDAPSGDVPDGGAALASEPKTESKTALAAAQADAAIDDAVAGDEGGEGGLADGSISVVESAEDVAARAERVRAIEEMTAENSKLKSELELLKQAVQQQEQQQQEQLRQPSKQPPAAAVQQQRPAYAPPPQQQGGLNQSISHTPKPNGRGVLRPFASNKARTAPLVTCEACGMQVLASVPVCYHCGSNTPVSVVPPQKAPPNVFAASQPPPPNAFTPQPMPMASQPLGNGNDNSATLSVSMAERSSELALSRADLSFSVPQPQRPSPAHPPHPADNTPQARAAAERAEIVRIARSTINVP